MKYSLFSVAFAAGQASGSSREFVIMMSADALVRNSLAILLSLVMIAATAYAEPKTSTPAAAARESEIERGYVFCRDGSFKSELHCARAAEKEHQQTPSKPFLFGVYYKIWEQTERSLNAVSTASPPSKDLDAIKGLQEQREKYFGLAEKLRAEIGLGSRDCWQFSLQEPCGAFSSATPDPEEKGK